MIIYFLSITFLVFILLGIILHDKYFTKKLHEIEPYGQMIDVYDGQMHIYTMGTGAKTIVLLPGIGVPLPSADFGPLIRCLSKCNYTVICIEYFGVGFSTKTQRARTCENYVDEIRTVLSKAGFKSPYILMPHSISSVYSEYYAEKYPDEIEAVISLDGTSTAYMSAEIPGFIKYLFNIAKFQQKIGLTSILGYLTANKKKLLSLEYTDKEINNMICYTGFAINNNLLEQMTSSIEFIRTATSLPYPNFIPYMKIISKKTYETKNKQIKISPQEYQKQHLARIGNHAKYHILDGDHFIYHNNTDLIAKITDEFLSKCN